MGGLEDISKKLGLDERIQFNERIRLKTSENIVFCNKLTSCLEGLTELVEDSDRLESVQDLVDQIKSVDCIDYGVVAESLYHIGSYWVEKETVGDLKKAIRSLNRALSENAKTGDNDRLKNVLVKLGRAYRIAGVLDPDQARNYAFLFGEKVREHFLKLKANPENAFRVLLEVEGLVRVSDENCDSKKTVSRMIQTMRYCVFWYSRLGENVDDAKEYLQSLEYRTRKCKTFK